MLFNRSLSPLLRRRAAGKLGRIVVLTGARQTGKTTLVRQAFPELQYLSMEDPLLRSAYTRMSASEWSTRHPRAIVDEVQKTPSLIETIKAAYDASPEVRYLLLGSSQILLLSKVRESLAGRAAIEELWPLTLPEMATSSWDQPVCESRLIAWLKAARRSGTPRQETLFGIPAASRGYARDVELLGRYVRFGGMPVVGDETLTDEEREAWLHDYRRTYLERDIADLAALRDLEPFVLAQKAVAARAGRILNVSDVARTAQVAVATAQRFLRYLEISYQVLLLRPFFRNLDKRLAKQPKAIFVDPGVLRSTLGHRGEPTGEEFESAVVAEIWKQIRNAALPCDLFHLRTHDGREVDLLIELEHGFVAVEVKLAEHVSDSDARHMRGLQTLLDKPLLASLVLSRDPDARPLPGGALALPAAWALGPAEAE